MNAFLNLKQDMWQNFPFFVQASFRYGTKYVNFHIVVSNRYCRPMCFVDVVNCEFYIRFQGIKGRGMHYSMQFFFNRSRE